MLRELHISNLAVIEEAHLEFHEGLNCFTGETGAGKSLVLGAFEILLGLRSGTDYLRPGAEESRVSGVFELRDDATAAAVGQLLDQTLTAGEQLLLTRKLHASGRSSFSANGMPATAAMIKAVGELLVDVHGQHDHQFLKPSNQLLILDAFAGGEELREKFSTLHRQIGEATRGRLSFAQGASLRVQQIELLEFQAQEIDNASPAAGEFDELKDRHRRLSNVQKLKREAGQVYSALYEAQGAILERLRAMGHVLEQLTEIDDRLKDPSQQVTSSVHALQDAAMDLARYVDRLDLEPEELGEVEEPRLNTLNRLIAKYGSAAGPGQDPLAAVLVFRDQVEGQLRDLRGQDADVGQIDQHIAAWCAELAEVGRSLTAARQAAATKLRPLVEKELAELGMAEARFTVDLLPQTDTASGLEAAEMMVTPNPGQPARPLRKVASGGELSRVMLAVKSILAGNDRVSVLVFDEIDANIGGRMGTVIGRKLHCLTGDGAAAKPKRGKAPEKSIQRHQVLCITHLPQIAAFADRHFRIRKDVEGKGPRKQTGTSVHMLSGEPRVEELAEMLAGKNATDTTRQQARELLEAAGR